MPFRLLPNCDTQELIGKPTRVECSSPPVVVREGVVKQRLGPKYRASLALFRRNRDGNLPFPTDDESSRPSRCTAGKAAGLNKALILAEIDQRLLRNA